MIEDDRLACDLDRVRSVLVERVRRALPEHGRCEETFQQWRETLGVTMRHAQNVQAKEYAMAMTREFIEELKLNGVTHI